MGDAVPVLLPDAPPSLEVQLAVKRRIVLPLSAPGVTATEMEALPRVTLVIVGGSGTAAGMTGRDGGEALLVPTALLAVTVHVYAAPLVRPVTVMGEPVSPALPGAPVSDVQLAV